MIFRGEEQGIWRGNSRKEKKRKENPPILSKTMRDLSQIPDTMPKWIVLDGDLDANWIEVVCAHPTLPWQRRIFNIGTNLGLSR